MEQIRHFHDLLRQNPLSVHTVRVFSLKDAPNNVVHVSGFCGKGEGIVELNVVSLADTVLSYS
jgi:hypothetical protein